MTERWFTEAQALQVAKDLQEMDRTMGDAMDYGPGTAWGDLSHESQQRWLARAEAELGAIVPLDLARPLRLRDGTPVQNARLSDDGLCVIADVAAWGRGASWPRNGMHDEEHPADLVYAAEETAPA